MSLNDLQERMKKMEKPQEPLVPVTPRKEEVEQLRKVAIAPLKIVGDFIDTASNTIKEKQKEQKIKDQVLNERSDGKSTYKNGKIVSIACQQCGAGEMKKHTKRPGIGLQILALILLISGILSFLAGGFFLVVIALIINFYSKNMWKCKNCGCTLPM